MNNKLITPLEDNILGLKKSINFTKLNEIFQNLLTNDKLISPANNLFPTIWECKWINDKNQPGYSKGDCFWLNTENVDDFLDLKHKEIFNYAKSNFYLTDKIKPYNKLDSDFKEIKKIYIDILNGNFKDINGNPIKIFEIGNIKKHIQLKISLKDNNKDDLFNTDAYADFFIDEQISKVKNKIEQIINNCFKTHLQNYHFENIKNDSLKNYIIFNINDFLNSDFSNLSVKNNTYLKKLYTSESSPIRNYTGFDFVKKFIKIKESLAEKSIEIIKWFRLWESGCLEHGGIVNIKQNINLTNNELIINFDWEYKNINNVKNVAPIYAYQIFNDKNIGELNCYNIVLTPIMSSENLKKINDEKINEVFNLKNTGFSIKLNPNIKKFSYFVKGVTNK